MLPSQEGLIEDNEPPSKRQKFTAEREIRHSKSYRRNTARLLLRMPMDIAQMVRAAFLGQAHHSPPYQVFSHLSPKDLIHIVQSSKYFAMLLLKSKILTVWKAVRMNIGAPEPPVWWTEPRWAGLLFGHHCQVKVESSLHYQHHY